MPTFGRQFAFVNHCMPIINSSISFSLPVCNSVIEVILTPNPIRRLTKNPAIRSLLRVSCSYPVICMVFITIQHRSTIIVSGNFQILRQPILLANLYYSVAIPINILYRHFNPHVRCVNCLRTFHTISTDMVNISRK